jgi:AAA15 family ATPase/GTPase
MQLKTIEVSNFKRLKNAILNLSEINIIVGGNNAGKSSLLQAIHFSVGVGVTAREQGETTFSTDSLTYIPAADFINLRHGQPYQNSTEQPFSGIQFSAEIDGELNKYKISIRRGRNYGNISCDRVGNFQPLGARITDQTKPFSIYVPGLAGIR